MRVLTCGLDEELAKLLGKRWVSKVDIATAWATESRALDTLVSTKRQLKVRTLAGFAGNHTTPGALKKLAELGPVRLVDSSAGLFHVKLFLFRGSRRSLAWVGSANFTGPGFGRNEELLYETEDTDELQDWFNRRWKEIGSQPNQPAAYCREWKRNDVPMLGVTDGPKRAGSRRDEAVMVFEQEGTRPPPPIRGKQKKEPPRGVVIVGGVRYPYSSAQKCLPLVLNALQKRDKSFLDRCLADPRFSKRRGSRYIGRRREDLGSDDFRRYATPLDNGWWLSAARTQTQEKWKLILAAAEIAGMSVSHGEMWQAETNARIKVGF